MRKSSCLAPLDSRGWLADRPEPFLEWVASAGTWRTYQRGQLIYDAGDPPDGIYGLGEGAVDVFLPAVGDELVMLHRADTGFWAGDLALLAGGDRLVTIRASLPSRVFVLPGSAVKRRLAEEPDDWPNFYALSYLNYVQALTVLAEALSLPPAARIARRVNQLTALADTATISQDELASLLGVTRITVQRALRELIAAGAIRTGYRTITVRDRGVLDRFAACRGEPAAEHPARVPSAGALGEIGRAEVGPGETHGGRLVRPPRSPQGAPVRRG